MAISKRLRFEILRRDNHACRYCGATAPDVKITIDHVVPVALGGDDTPDNLVTACSGCNTGKSSVPLDAPIIDDIGQRARLWEQARREALADVRSERGKEDAEDQAFYKHWCTWNYKGNPLPIDGQWRTTLGLWRRQGLSVDDLKPMVTVAMNRKGISNGDVWRYFCGIVWRTLDDIENRAAEKVARIEEVVPERLLERVWIASANHVFPHPASRYVDPDDYEPVRRDTGYEFDDAAMWSH